MISLLASVRDLEEAREAADAGADLIDLKEPSAGALGGLDTRVIREITASIHGGWPGRPTSATIGDFLPGEHAARCAKAREVAACGVDYVKVGIVPGSEAATALRDLARLRLPSVVIVLLADAGIDLQLAQAAAAMGFAGLMLDTGDKSSGSLLTHADPTALNDFIAVARRHGLLCGLAGSLRAADVGLLHQLGPDFAGFRGALCEGGRRGRLDAGKLRSLRAALRGEGAPAGRPGASAPARGVEPSGLQQHAQP